LFASSWPVTPPARWEWIDRVRKLPIPVVAVALALIIGAAVIASKSNNYQVAMVFPNANNLFAGATVMRDGFKAGTVKKIEVVDGKAKATLKLNDGFAPLHDGVRAEVVWKGVLGERQVQLTDGPEKNAAVPSGALLTNVAAEPVELSDVMSSLNAPTRKKLNTLIANINATTSGHETDIRNSLITAGPAVEALGAVLSDLGTDGEAIRQILTQSNRTMGILAARQQSLAQIVADLSDMSSDVVKRRQELGETLDRLPGVIDQANTTLEQVPDAVDETVPLLKDLDPATKKLAKTSKHLKPVMQDLRPAVADLKPTLASLAELLQHTPAFMRAGKATFPDIDNALDNSQDAVRFLRPYTPELVGWMSNWGSAGGNYDANGHYARFHILEGAESVIPSPGLKGPGVTQNLTPKPGNPVGQPWEDAYGDDIR
jgi:phospholipid/cholesterol/gamma-HCH transport system substrate-binding protein